jgi:hypothetical protein
LCFYLWSCCWLSVRCALNATPEAMSSAVKETEAFINGLQLRSGSQSVSTEDFYSPVSSFYFILFYFILTILASQSKDFQRNCSQTHFKLPFQVNYAAQSCETVPYSHKDFARYCLAFITRNVLKIDAFSCYCRV